MMQEVEYSMAATTGSRLSLVLLGLISLSLVRRIGVETLSPSLSAGTPVFTT